MQSLASQGTIIVSIRTMLDLLSSPAEFKYFGAIASEAASIFQNEEDFGNVESLHKLSRIDSAIRESARLNPTTGRGMMHEVVHKNGVILPDGNKVCHGTWLGVSVVGINQDERYYADPHKYDPFRFSRARTEAALTMGGTKNTDSLNKETGEKLKATVPNKPNGSWLSTAQEEFGTFGYGRHSWSVSLLLLLLPPFFFSFSKKICMLNKSHHYQPGAMVCISRYEDDDRIHCSQIRDSANQRVSS